MGGDKFKVSEDLSDAVSIHAPAWGATVAKPMEMGGGEVSIHAPAWGATAHGARRWELPAVSIHAPAWGATSPAAIKSSTPDQFQSTPPHGGRRQ